MLKKILAIVFFPIAVILCLSIILLSSLLWIPYFILFLIEKLFGINTTAELAEFIFIWYGFASLMIYLPLSVLVFENDLF